MNEKWRYTANSVTKYNPLYRDANGHYTKNEWLGFFQVGQIVDGKIFSLEEYLEVEGKYIEAAYCFFQFHKCDSILIKSIEKKDVMSYSLADKDQLILLYERISDDQIIPIKDLGLFVKLVLRELAWGELFCINNPNVALRFGYDFYMYFNSNRDMTELFTKIEKIGLYID
jgi:hypothetical protein